MSKKLNNELELTETQVQENYDYFLEFLTKSFSGERLEKLMIMYNELNLGLELTTAPASGRKNYHYAHTGGYIQHVMDVEKASRGVQKVYEAISGEIDYTEEERIMAALHHDLGKLGDETGPYFIPNREAWSIEKQGLIFKHNMKNQFWKVGDRSLYNLQRFGIVLTWKETLAIRLADGLYDESAEFYLKTYDPEKGLKTNLPRIIHVADYLACNAENDIYRKKNA
jgi:hypothetical protein